MIESIQLAVGGMGVLAGVVCFAAYVDEKEKVFAIFALIFIPCGLWLLLTLPKIQNETPTYSSEWIDEETKCHFWGQTPLNCESVRYMEEL